MKDKLIILRHRLQEVIDKHPFDATEKETGYTIAMEHVVMELDKILKEYNDVAEYIIP